MGRLHRGQETFIRGYGRPNIPKPASSRAPATADFWAFLYREISTSRYLANQFVFMPSQTPHNLCLIAYWRQCSSTPFPVIRFEQPSVVNVDAFPKDRVGGNPTIYAPPIVPDLIPLPLNRFDQVKIFVAIYLAQHNISYFDGFWVNRFYSTKLSGFNLAGHRITAWPK